MNDSRYIIGIDLGTTNSTLSYSPSVGDNPRIPGMPLEISTLAIPQVVEMGTEEALSSLPSSLYVPLPEEAAAKAVAVSWDPAREFCLGAYAQQRGGELPGRLVTSAKSWLCHDGIDRRAPLLPIVSDEGIAKRSPVAVSADILRHLREVWDLQHPDAPFEQQTVLVAVPASFDPSARQLTQEAAAAAGYPSESTILLEEPQAAFYAWLHAHADDWRERLKIGDKVLVVDIGGGTTDFTLISVEEQGGDLALERLAVGAHLLLGGDNMDLALAYAAKAKLEEEGYDLDDWQLHSLTHACRTVKERLLGEAPPEQMDVTIHGRGSRLIGGTLKTVLTREEVHASLVDGFIPMVAISDQAKAETHLGLRQVGLPYAQDARISCQLARFLAMAGGESGPVIPTAILFNGGTMKAAALRERFVALIDGWAAAKGLPAVAVLPAPSYDYAVSVGAAYYGQARQGNAVRIRGGISHSYFVGVEGAAPAVPGVPPPFKAICVAPLGMEEGTEADLPGQEFALVLGEPASFRFFSRNTPTLSGGSTPMPGTVVDRWKTELTELHPIEAALEREEGDGSTVRVALKSTVTELGTLQLWCVAHDGRRWKLEFDTRGIEKAKEPPVDAKA